MSRQLTAHKNLTVLHPKSDPVLGVAFEISVIALNVEALKSISL